MADFCKTCSEKYFGKDFQELSGLAEPGKAALALCEGCGEVIWVDEFGKRLTDEEVDALYGHPG